MDSSCRAATAATTKTTTTTNASLPKEVRLSKVLVNFKPRKLSDFLARCESERAASAARAQAQARVRGDEQRQPGRSRCRRGPTEDRWVSDVELRPSPAAPPSRTRSENDKNPSRLLPNRLPHRQLLSVAQYNELLSQFAHPPALEQMAKWHSNLRNYDGAAEKSNRSHSLSSFQSAPRPAGGTKVQSNGDPRGGVTRGSTRSHCERSLLFSATPSGQPARAGSDSDSSSQHLKLLAKDIRDLDKSTRMLRKRYSLQVPHSSPLGSVRGRQEEKEDDEEDEDGRGSASSNVDNGTDTHAETRILGNAAAATREALKTLAQFARQRGNAIVVDSVHDHHHHPSGPAAEDTGSAQQRLVSLLVADSPPTSGDDEGASDSDVEQGKNAIDRRRSAQGAKQHCKTEGGASTLEMQEFSSSSSLSSTCEAESRQAAGFEAAMAAAAVGKSGSGSRRGMPGRSTFLHLPPAWRCQLQIDAGIARRYLSGAHFTIAEFLTRHGAAVRTCFEDVRTFERRVASSTSTGVSLNAIDAQIATRRVQVLRLHYGIAALALYRDAAALRRQLVEGLQTRRRTALLQGTFGALAANCALSQLRKRWQRRNPHGSVFGLRVRELFHVWRQNVQLLVSVGQQFDRERRLSASWRLWVQSLVDRRAARRAKRVQSLLASRYDSHPAPGGCDDVASDEHHRSSAENAALAEVLGLERQEAQRVSEITRGKGAAESFVKGENADKRRLCKKGLRRWLGHVVVQARDRYLESLAADMRARRGGLLKRAFNCWSQLVRRQLAQQAAITSEFVLLLRCFKAWAVDVRARRVEFQDRVAAVKAGLFRRSVLLARCFDSWAQFVDVPSMEPDADTSTIGATR